MKIPYFKLREALEEAKDSLSYGSGTEKISSVARLVGKTVANAGMLATETAIEVGKELSKPETMAKILSDGLKNNRGNMSSDKIEHIERRIDQLKEKSRSKD